MALFTKEPAKNPKTHPTTTPHVPAPSEGKAYLDRGSKITGQISFEGPALIDGEVDGEINAKGSLTIGESAVDSGADSDRASTALAESPIALVRYPDDHFFQPWVCAPT